MFLVVFLVHIFLVAPVRQAVQADDHGRIRVLPVGEELAKVEASLEGLKSLLAGTTSAILTQGASGLPGDIEKLEKAHLDEREAIKNLLNVSVGTKKGLKDLYDELLPRIDQIQLRLKLAESTATTDEDRCQIARMLMVQPEATLEAIKLKDADRIKSVMDTCQSLDHITRPSPSSDDAWIAAIKEFKTDREKMKAHMLMVMKHNDELIKKHAKENWETAAVNRAKLEEIRREGRTAQATLHRARLAAARPRSEQVADVYSELVRAAGAFIDDPTPTATATLVEKLALADGLCPPNVDQADCDNVKGLSVFSKKLLDVPHRRKRIERLPSGAARSTECLSFKKVLEALIIDGREKLKKTRLMQDTLDNFVSGCVSDEADRKAAIDKVTDLRKKIQALEACDRDEHCDRVQKLRDLKQALELAEAIKDLDEGLRPRDWQYWVHMARTHFMENDRRKKL